MCGKFTQMASWKEVHAFSQPLVADPNEPAVTATLMRFAQVLRLNRDGAREVVSMRWGFAEKNAAAPARPKYMHARCETIDTRPTFAVAFRESRGLALVSSFNEGEALAKGKTKQWVIAPRHGGALALAVIFEHGATAMNASIRLCSSRRRRTLSSRASPIGCPPYCRRRLGRHGLAKQGRPSPTSRPC